ncbi:DUF1192 domain-containing protein [Polycladidibacter stylochi]|uniref:DUF1192 domain-containing protein n=1 Tax=Polycladidibacter stylochi TaxID=1807766 RepID=UPI000B0C2118|nr:DUF1192 domain-containing protein [Pseudovibrio stylochi]
MSVFDETPRKPLHETICGQDLSGFSIEELQERLQILGQEIERTKESMNQKKKHHSAAQELFKS